MKGKIKTRREVRTTNFLSVGKKDFLNALGNCGTIIPEGATVFVRVPGGGDWSNENLEIDDDDCSIHVQWEETEFSEG